MGEKVLLARREVGIFCFQAEFRPDCPKGSLISRALLLAVKPKTSKNHNKKTQQNHKQLKPNRRTMLKESGNRLGLLSVPGSRSNTVSMGPRIQN